MNRRAFLKAGLVAAPTAAAAGAGGVGRWWAGADLNTAGRIRFVNRLAVPPLARSRRDAAGRRVFDLRAAAGRHRFRPGRPTPHGRTAAHVYRGLTGMFILDEPEPPRLPHRYGIDDIPVTVRDINLTDENRLDEGERFQAGVGIVGEFVTVNGTLAPYLPVTTQRIRLRLLNASASRIYRFGLASGRPFTLVGTDGGLLPTPHGTGRVQLSPGERAEIVVDMRPDERDVLRSFPPRTGLDFWDRRLTGGDDTLDVLQLRAAPRLAPSPPIPDRLAEAPRLAAPQTPPHRTFELAKYTINGRTMDMNRIDFAVAHGSTEVWEVTAIDGSPHNFHVHDVQFQVLSVGNEPPQPHLRGWKDTIHTPPNVPIRIAMRFRSHPNPAVPYMFHCHIPSHEDRGLMGQFVVTPQGQPPRTAVASSHRH